MTHGISHELARLARRRPNRVPDVHPLAFDAWHSSQGMKIQDIPFGATAWHDVEPTRHEGETGFALWRTRQFGDIRVRVIEYSPGYKADHWCSKGHILFVLEGELQTELADGRVFTLRAGTSYQVADGAEPHLSTTTSGAKLFVVD
jgi:quercetin dioxygenase-like cupin family protein